MTLLKVTNLTVFYPHAVTPAVSDLSFSVQDSFVLGVAGESGSGKSTVSKALMGLLPDQAQLKGSICLLGQEMIGFSEAQWRSLRGHSVALVLQDPMQSFNPLRAMGSFFMELVRLYRPGLSKQDCRDCIRDAFDLVHLDLSDVWFKYPHQLSGGMLQRLSIAAACLGEPRLIIADEVTTALDVLVQRKIVELLLRLCADKQMGLVFVSHDLALLSEVCDRVMLLKEGREESFSGAYGQGLLKVLQPDLF